MMNEKLFKKLEKGFKYLEKYDELGDYPDKKVPVSIGLPLALKHRLKQSKIENISRYIAGLIVKDLAKRKSQL